MGEPRVRIELDGTPVWGHRDGDRIVCDDGRSIDERDAQYLAPVAPSKIIAVHLTYQSRLTEYARQDARLPVVLHEAADDAQRAPRPCCVAHEAPASSTTRVSWRS